MAISTIKIQIRDRITIENKIVEKYRMVNMFFDIFILIQKRVNLSDQALNLYLD